MYTSFCQNFNKGLVVNVIRGALQAAHYQRDVSVTVEAATVKVYEAYHVLG